MDLNEVHKSVSKIRGKLFKKSNGHNIGMLKSSFRGTGLQFKEHRLYTHGDDVRFIDWKMFAKTSSSYIKTFEEERNVEIVVVLDATSSMFYGYKGTSKFQSALEIVCLLYLLAKETSDFVHVVVVGRDVVDIPKTSGEKGIARLFLTLTKMGILNDDGKINLNYQFEKFLNAEIEKKILKYVHKKREVVILSGWGDVFRELSFERILFQKNIHSFRILAPIDVGSIEPVTIKGVDLKTKKNKFVTIKSVNRKNSQISLKQTKDLHLNEHYLDNFIKEML